MPNLIRAIATRYLERLDADVQMMRADLEAAITIAVEDGADPEVARERMESTLYGEVLTLREALLDLAYVALRPIVRPRP